MSTGWLLTDHHSYMENILKGTFIYYETRFSKFFRFSLAVEISYKNTRAKFFIKRIKIQSSQIHIKPVNLQKVYVFAKNQKSIVLYIYSNFFCIFPSARIFGKI